jgi:hypothetical protein
MGYVTGLAMGHGGFVVGRGGVKSAGLELYWCTATAEMLPTPIGGELARSLSMPVQAVKRRPWAVVDQVFESVRSDWMMPGM